jgi:hypothetical protein
MPIQGGLFQAKKYPGGARVFIGYALLVLAFHASRLSPRCLLIESLFLPLIDLWCLDIAAPLFSFSPGLPHEDLAISLCLFRLFMFQDAFCPSIILAFTSGLDKTSRLIFLIFLLYLSVEHAAATALHLLSLSFLEQVRQDFFRALLLLAFCFGSACVFIIL